LAEPYPAKMKAKRVADSEAMYPFECEVDSATRFSRQITNADRRFDKEQPLMAEERRLSYYFGY